MELDYGKRAYIKVLELEKKLEDLIKESERDKIKTLTFDLSVPETKATFNRTLKFIATDDCVASVSIKLTAPESVPIFYEILRNSEVVKTGKTEVSETFIAFDLGVFSGENVVDVSLMAGVPFPLDELSVTVQGKVNYLTSKRRLSCVDVGGENYIVYLNENTYTLYSYAGGNLVEKYRTNVYDACILGYINGELYIGSISLDYGLKITIYRTSTGSSLTTKALVNGVSSVCGYQSGETAVIVYVKTGVVYKGTYERASGYSEQPTYRRGSSVFADPNVDGAYVILDGYKPTKFIVNNVGTFVINKGDNYHIEKSNDCYKITYSSDGKLISQTVYDKVSNPIKLSFLDEEIKLFDGKTLMRVRDKLTIGG